MVLIMMRNNPKVIMVIGKESTIKIGFRNILSTPTTKANNKASEKSLTWI
jgi:hypothetical protein